jgi:hypothetical protein
MQAAIVAALNAKGSDIASATTTDLSATNGLFHDITGTTDITGFGTVRAGIWKILKFEGVLTLTHNATSLILPGAANITTADGDMLMVSSEGSGNWRGEWFTRAASIAATLAGTETFTNKTLTAAVLGGTTNVSGGQLQFPATQSASAGVNTLDDYEEGTWTPSLGGTATYTTQIGTYTKIGRLVTIQMYLTVNLLGTGSASTISGLPFASGASASTFVPTTLFWSGLAVAYDHLVGLIEGGTSTIQMFGSAVEAASLTATTPIGDATSLGMTASYIV